METDAKSARTGNDACSLRQRAEAAMLRLGNSDRVPEADDIASLLQELTIHKIEIEMQGEELRRSAESLAAAKSLTYFQDDTQARKNSAEFERLSLIARHTENMVIFTGSDRKITWVNEGFVKLTGYSLDEVLGKSPSILQGAGTDPATTKRMRIALKEGRPVSEEILNYTKSGKPYWASIEIIPQRNSSGTLTGFMSIQRDITQCRNREDQLLKLRRAVEQSANAIVITDTVGNIEYVNPAFERNTGYTASEALGKNPRFLKSGDQQPDFYVDLWAKITSGQTWKGIFHNRRKDGTLFWEAATISQVLDSAGRVTNYIAVKENINDRIEAESALVIEHERLAAAFDEIRRAESTLRESEDLLDRAGQVAGVGGWDLDIATMTPRWTRQTRILHEVEPDFEPSLKEVLSFYAPEARPVVQQAVQEGIENGASWDIEVPFVTGKGRQIWVRMLGRPDVENGKTTRIVGTFQDITARKTAEIAFEKERDRLANVIEGTNLASWEWNVQTGELVVNERWAAICGYTLEELAPISVETWRRLVHPEDLAKTQIKLDRHFSGELPMYESVFQMQHKDGRWVWNRATGRLISRTRAGLPLMMYGTQADVTEDVLKRLAIKETNEKLRQANIRAEAASRAKGDFLANMSHEIRTPLNAIIGMSELLETDPTGPDAREFLRTIRSSADSLLALINDILDFSKIEAGQLDLERVPVNLGECAEAAINTVSMFASRRSLRVVSEIDPSLPAAILGDPLRLRQILINLLNNAVKFTEAGEVGLRVFRAGDSQIGFAVKDTGIGITPEQQEKLFQSFSQADSSTTRRFGGSGLGLAISRNLVEMMGGEIRVDSAHGAGSTFHFSIPLVKSEAHPPKPGRKPGGSMPDPQFASRIPMDILIVEDNMVNQRLVEMMLRRLGYAPALAANGLEALKALEKSRYDLVFMDIQMPEMDGLAATGKICEIYPPDVRPQIVALTANAMDGDREVCLAAGMHDYLAKPVRHEQLAGVIERAAARAREIAPS